MKLWWLIPAVPIGSIAFLVGTVIYLQGKMAGREEVREERCCSGDLKPCVYGPGIVGVQRCALSYWDKCEPDPRFRVPQPEASSR